MALLTSIKYAAPLLVDHIAHYNALDPFPD